MRTFVKAGFAAAIAASALAFAAAPASAQSRVQVGVLTCHIAPTMSFIIGSVRELQCTLAPSRRGGPKGTYTGTVRRFGLDIGVSGQGTMVWTVMAPTDKVGRKDLRGTYVGASTNVALGVGLGANVLVGGSNNTIALQPLSIEGQTGFNLALGVAELTLR